jgi:hypothetical protein
LEAFFKWKVVSIDEDDRDDFTSGKYWEFIELDELECWSIMLDPMTSSTHFGNVADITIWSSMRVATVKSVCDLLFVDFLVKPVNILG